MSRVQNLCIKGHQTVVRPQLFTSPGHRVLHDATATHPCPSVAERLLLTQIITRFMSHGETKRCSHKATGKAISRDVSLNAALIPKGDLKERETRKTSQSKHPPTSTGTLTMIHRWLQFVVTTYQTKNTRGFENLAVFKAKSPISQPHHPPKASFYRQKSWHKRDTYDFDPTSDPCEGC